MKKSILLFGTVLISFSIRCQDTFSILAYDSITREIGAAGASCLDLDLTGFQTNHFITEILPDTGAIATQAAYVGTNQLNARTRMRAGDSPAQIMTWLLGNDITLQPSIRQYGAIRIGHASAAHTGGQCQNYKSHIVGPNYTIHGNILLGQKVLDSMEARFLNTQGDLACKLMGAMQGAKMVGADSRCAGNNSSSLFAFLKVSNPGNAFGTHDLIVSLRTSMGDSIEPIDSLQKLFDFEHVCPSVSDGIEEFVAGSSRVHPNPASGVVLITVTSGKQGEFKVRDQLGRVVHSGAFEGSFTLDIRGWEKGLYFFEILEAGRKYVEKVIIQ